jgi:ABC-type sugar transport system, periplasmic component
MKKLFFQVLGSMLAVMLLFTAAGCGNKTAADQKDTTQAQVTTQAQTTNAQETSKDTVKIRFSSYLLDAAQAGNTYLAAIDEFQKANPGIAIDSDYIPASDYVAGLKTRLLGGEDMGIIDIWSPALFLELKSLLGNDCFVDLTNLDVTGNFLPATLAPVTVDGKVYGLPEGLVSVGLIYNKTIFDKYKIAEPMNWTEFLVACETLKKNNIIPIAMGSESTRPQFLWGPIVNENGGVQPFTQKLESGEIKITDPIFVDAIKKAKLLIDKEYIDKNWMGVKAEQAKDLVGQGKAGMVVTGTWDLPSVMDRDKNSTFEFMTVPGNESGKPIIGFGVTDFRVISSKFKNPDEAKTFLSYMHSQAMLDKICAAAKYAPTTKTYNIDDPLTKSLATKISSPDAVLVWPHTISKDSLNTKIQEGVQRYLSGADLDKTLAEIQKDIDDAKGK